MMKTIFFITIFSLPGFGFEIMFPDQKMFLDITKQPDKYLFDFRLCRVISVEGQIGHAECIQPDNSGYSITVFQKLSRQLVAESKEFLETPKIWRVTKSSAVGCLLGMLLPLKDCASGGTEQALGDSDNEEKFKALQSLGFALQKAIRAQNEQIVLETDYFDPDGIYNFIIQNLDLIVELESNAVKPGDLIF